METINTNHSKSSRVTQGNAILLRAKVADTSPVKQRLREFAAAHDTYCKAQDVVDRARTALRAQKQHVARLDEEQDRSLTVLALQLVSDGEPSNNPFAAMGGESLARLVRKPYAEEVRAIYNLAALVQNNQGRSNSAREAARLAGAAAAKVEDGVRTQEDLNAALRVARQERDALARNWDAARSGLLHSALAASRTDVPGLYDALFGRRPSKGASSAEDIGPSPPQLAPPPALPVPPPAPAPAPLEGGFVL